MLMTLVVMMFILLPSVAPPVQAVVGVDDAVLATSAVALLFLGLCGVTFASSSDAVAGVQAFLAKQADGAQRLASIASEYVKDGVLTLNSAVKDAFEDIKDGIKEFFSGVSVSLPSLSDTALSGFPTKSKIQSGTITTNIIKYSQCMVSDLIGAKVIASNKVFYGVFWETDQSWGIRFLPEGHLDDLSYNGYKPIDWSFSKSSGEIASSTYLCLYDPGYPSVHAFTYDPSCSTYSDRSFLSSSDSIFLPVQLSIPFEQDQLVDGTSASSALDNAPNVSDTPLDDMPYLPIDAMTGVINRGQSESEEDQASAPGLIPEDLVKQLQDALAGGAVLPTSPAETEPTTGDDVIDPNLPITTGFWNKFFQGAKTWGEDVISGIGDKLKGIGEDIASGAQKVGETITSGVDVISSTLSDILEWIKSIPGQLLSGLEALFVPDMAALADTVLEMRAEYPFFDSILVTGQAIGNAISASSGPPVVYVHLENDEGQFTYGGTVAVLDMSFYERYKSVGDVVISSFMLLAFAWRVFVKLPGIISGVPGDVQVFQNVAGEDRRKKK